MTEKNGGNKMKVCLIQRTTMPSRKYVSLSKKKVNKCGSVKHHQ